MSAVKLPNCDEPPVPRFKATIQAAAFDEIPNGLGCLQNPLIAIAAGPHFPAPVVVARPIKMPLTQNLPLDFPLATGVWKQLLGIEPANTLGWSILLVLAGMLLITKGGDLFTDSAVAVAHLTRIPTVLIGATVVSLATTFPEFMVSLTGAMSGVSAFAVGNALGSCICNIGLIVGTCALLKAALAGRRGEEPAIPVNRQTLLKTGSFTLAAALLTWFFAAFDAGGAVDSEQVPAAYGIARWQAGLLVVVLLLFLGYTLRTALAARFEAELEEAANPTESISVSRTVGLFLLGAALVVVGSRILVANAEQIAYAMEIPKLIVGLTVLAVGTSLPEYTISLIAVIKGHGALGIGNIIGANILNLCWVVATCALIHPLPIERQTLVLDAPIVLLLTVMLIGMGSFRERISAATGGCLFLVYVSYLICMFTLFQ